MLCFGCFAARQQVNGDFLLTHCKIYNWLLNACTLKTCHWIVMSMFQFRKTCLCYQFSSLLIVLFLCQLSSLACWTTNGRDTCQLLTTILFKVRVNNSSKFFTLTKIQEKFFWFFVSGYLQFLDQDQNLKLRTLHYTVSVDGLENSNGLHK